MFARSPHHVDVAAAGTPRRRWIGIKQADDVAVTTQVAQDLQEIVLVCAFKCNKVCLRVMGGPHHQPAPLPAAPAAFVGHLTGC